MGGSYDLSRIIGQHPEILQIIARVKKIVETRSNVLFIGEVGTGKRLIARAIHFSSPRADKAFMTVNLRAIPAKLCGSKTLWAGQRVLARLKNRSHGVCWKKPTAGTLYLNGIELLSSELQLKLLHVLEDKEVRPVGKAEGIKIDLLVISSSNLELGDARQDRAIPGRPLPAAHRRHLKNPAPSGPKRGPGTAGPVFHSALRPGIRQDHHGHRSRSPGAIPKL